jgi:MFS family permease
MGLTAFSVAFMVARVGFGHLPDQIGGAKVAVGSMVIEAIGLFVIWNASGLATALLGVVLSGLGYALVYPGLGVEAVRNAPPQSRGAAMGTYTAFLDLSLGVASPMLGFTAQAVSLNAVFLASALIVVATIAIAYFLVIPRPGSYRLEHDEPLREVSGGVRA